MGTSQNVELEAAKFLQKLIQDSKDEPAKLATKLYVILQHMKSSGKEHSMPYQVISRNYNYGATGDGIKADLLNHPEYVEQNATIAFQAAIWRWMTPIKKSQPSAHDAFVGNWKPTKNDTLSKRVPGFGATMNILYGERTCGQGDIDPMNTIISHYLYYLDLLGVGREQAGPSEVLSCAEQVAFNPVTTANTATS